MIKKPKIKFQIIKPVVDGSWRMEVCVDGKWAFSPYTAFSTRRDATLWAKNWCHIMGMALLEKAK